MSQRRPPDDPSSAPESGTVREAPELDEPSPTSQRQPQPGDRSGRQRDGGEKDDPSHAGEER